MMAENGDQAQTTSWYQLCFLNAGSDNSSESDDSDVESVVITPATPISTSIQQEFLSLPLSLSPPLPLAPNLQYEIDWTPLPMPQPQSDFLPHSANSTPISTWIEPLPLPSLPNPEFEIDLSLPLPRPLPLSLPPLPPVPDLTPPPPPPLERASARIFNIEVQQDSDVFEGDQSDRTMETKNGISMVTVSDIQKFSNCPICMDEFEVGDQACQLPCTHFYCRGCIFRWLNSSLTCPICRHQLKMCDFDVKKDNNGLHSQSEIPLPQSLINDNIGLDSPFEVLPPQSSESRYISLARWLASMQSSPSIRPDTENSAGGNSDEADYDSACDDELDDIHEGGASQNDPHPPI
ncbi:hypothetical protein VNO78_30928 [Psophocarpus tetragonolobus]|uniref:RING-type E3 ubiquitin transferase n=1 Tax=Psophocarpus tetragonolobus TaxID=3891 RepID=A0AAN9X6J7_PSOTE